MSAARVCWLYHHQLFQLYKVYSMPIQRTLCSKPSYKISTLFDGNTTNHQITRNKIYSILSPLGDFSVSIDDFRSMKNNLHPKQISSFWPCIIDYAISNNYFELRKSLINYILSDKHEHSNTTLIKMLNLLIYEECYNDFKMLYNELIARLTPVEKKVFFNDLAKLLARSPYWRESLELLSTSEMNGFDYTKVYEMICLSAIKFDNVSSVFECLNQLKCCPKDDVFFKFFDKLSTVEEEEEQEEAVGLVDQLFQLMRTHRWIMSSEVAKYIDAWFCKLKDKRWMGNLSAHISSRGYFCSVCNGSLPPADMSQFRLSEMADRFFETVVKGTDIRNLFMSAKSDEIDTLHQFLDSQTEPLDCIIDFLNLMNTRRFQFTDSSGILVAEVLRQINKDFNLRRFCLVSKGNTTLRRPGFWNPIKILGNQLGISVHKFCTNAKSEDDAFLLYMALKSGPQCYIVSNDEFKNYRFSAGRELGEQISRWQSHRHIVLQPFIPSVYLKPSKCDLSVHGSRDIGWHIPYHSGKSRKFYTAVNSWLCLRRVK
ncbi:unnamed protein product [Trichobilharzia szidati]|nr:unnamed protein product [Trichobilharzia szidati]